MLEYIKKHSNSMNTKIKNNNVMINNRLSAEILPDKFIYIEHGEFSDMHIKNIVLSRDAKLINCKIYGRIELKEEASLDKCII